MVADAPTPTPLPVATAPARPGPHRAARLRALARRHRWAAGFVLLYLYSFPYFPAIRSANELPRAYLVQAMVDHGTFRIDHGVARWGTTADVSPSGGHHYSNKAPGSSMLAVPAYLLYRLGAAAVGAEPTLAGTVLVSRLWTGVVPGLLFLLLLSRFLRRYAPDPDVRRMVLLAYGLGSMAMTYSVLFISHQLAAIAIAAAWIVAVEVGDRTRSWRWLGVAGLLAGAAPLIDYQAAFAGVPVALAVLPALWRTLGAAGARGRGLVLALAGAALPIGVLLGYHAVCFGSPLRTGYDASETFAHFHQQGFLGITTLRWDAFVGSTVAGDNGLFTFSPWLVLVVPGWWLLWRRGQAGDRATALMSIAVAVIYLLFISSINFWRGGWQLGPRYITAMLPFLLPPVAMAMSAAATRWAWRGLVLGLIGVGVVVYAVSAAEFPHFPDRYRNPLYEITFRLIGDDLAPYNLGWLLGLRGLASLVPYLVVLGLVVGVVAVPGRPHLRAAALAVVVTTAVIASYAWFPRSGRAADEAYRRYVAVAMPGEPR